MIFPWYFPNKFFREDSYYHLKQEKNGKLLSNPKRWDLCESKKNLEEYLNELDIKVETNSQIDIEEKGW